MKSILVEQKNAKKRELPNDCAVKTQVLPLEFNLFRFYPYNKIRKERWILANKSSPNALISFIMNDVAINRIAELLNQQYNEYLLLSLDNFGNTLLQVACLANRPDVIEMLCKTYGLLPDVRNKKGISPVEFAHQVEASSCHAMLLKMGRELASPIVCISRD